MGEKAIQLLGPIDEARTDLFNELGKREPDFEAAANCADRVAKAAREVADSLDARMFSARSERSDA